MYALGSRMNVAPRILVGPEEVRLGWLEGELVEPTVVADDVPVEPQAPDVLRDDDDDDPIRAAAGCRHDEHGRELRDAGQSPQVADGVVDERLLVASAFAEKHLLAHDRFARRHVE